MSDPSIRSRLTPALLAISVSIVALTAGSVSAHAETSEIDSFQMAATSQSKQKALAFIETYPSSHLIDDLIEMLPLEVAQQVCSDLADGGPARAQSACETLQRAYAVAPIEPAAGLASVDDQLPDAQTATTVEDPEGAPVAVRGGGNGKESTPYWLVPSRSNATRSADESSGGNSSDRSSSGGTGPGGSADGAAPSADSSGSGDSGGSVGGSTGGDAGGSVGDTGGSIGGSIGGNIGGSVGGSTSGDIDADVDTDIDADIDADIDPF